MPPSPEALVSHYSDRYNRLRVASGLVVGQLWDRYGGPSDSQQQEFSSRAANVVTAAVGATGTLVDGYLAALLSVLLAARVSPAGLHQSYARPVDPNEVYARAVVTMRAALAKGRAPDEASRAARARAVGSAETDVALAQRDAAREAFSREPRIVGYRRVLTGRSCMFCATASTQRYHKEDLLPLHAHCDCALAPSVEVPERRERASVEPVYGLRDPGRVINQELLRELRQQGGSKYWKDRGFVDLDEDGNFTVSAKNAEKRQLRVVTRDHGELGPVLTDADQDFTSEADIAA